MDKVSNIISCNWVGLVLSPYCTLMPWAQGPGLMETQMRTSIKDLQRCHGLRLVTVGHPVALSPDSVVTSMACCLSYWQAKDEAVLFRRFGAASTVGRKFRHYQNQKAFSMVIYTDMSTSCGSRRRIAHLSNFSKNPGSGHSVLILFPSVQCPEDMRSMLPWAARIRGLITWS